MTYWLSGINNRVAATLTKLYLTVAGICLPSLLIRAIYYGRTDNTDP